MKSGFSGVCSILTLLCSNYSSAMNVRENQHPPIFFRREAQNQRHVTFSLQEARANLYRPTISNQGEPKSESDTDDRFVLNLNKISDEELSQYKSFYKVSLFTAICKASLEIHFDFLHFFILWLVFITASCIMLQTSIHSSSETLCIRSNPLNLFVASTV